MDSLNEICQSVAVDFLNATRIVTLVDRLLHHADVTVIEGESYRVRESELEPHVSTGIKRPRFHRFCSQGKRATARTWYGTL